MSYWEVWREKSPSPAVLILTGRTVDFDQEELDNNSSGSQLGLFIQQVEDFRIQSIVY